MRQDNRQLNSWPAKQIIQISPTSNPTDDGEPYAQKIVLECKHWLINTYGLQFPEFKLGWTIRCGQCGELNDLHHSR